jgi:hypothetical protein
MIRLTMPGTSFACLIVRPCLLTAGLALVVEVRDISSPAVAAEGEAGNAWRVDGGALDDQQRRGVGPAPGSPSSLVPVAVDSTMLAY